MGQFSTDALGVVLGHRDNRTTFLWYVHMLDWSLGQHVRRPTVQPGLSAEALHKLTGVSVASIQRRTISAARELKVPRARRARGRRSASDYDPGTGFMDTFLRDIRRKWPLGEGQRVRAGKPVSLKPTNLAPALLAASWRALSGALAAMDRGISVDEVVVRFGGQADECAELARHADLISAIITASGRRRFRFAGWIDAPVAERVEAPGLRLLHQGRKRPLTRSQQPQNVDHRRAHDAERKRLTGEAARDVVRMDQLWPTMFRRRDHPWTGRLLENHLQRYSEACHLISFRDLNDAARYIRGLCFLGLPRSAIRIRRIGDSSWVPLNSVDRNSGASLRQLAEMVEQASAGLASIQVRVVRSTTEAPCPAVPYLLLLLSTVTNAGVRLGPQSRSLAVPRRFKSARGSEGLALQRCSS